MNDREISEIRRRMRPEKNNIGRIRGCYVNDNHTIISEFNQLLGMISNDESEEILSILRKTFSGSIGRNLIDISFSNQQVLEGEEHKLLTTLRESSLSDDEAVKTFFEKITATLDIDGSYLILLANDKYDIFTFSADGEKNESSEMFSYIVCAVCPIKAVKPTLGYNLSENKFKNIIRDSIVGAPEIGFMFPAYESKSANIYNSLYYTKSISEMHPEFIDAIFKTEAPRTASEQTESIAAILNESVATDCDIEFVQAIQSQLLEITQDHKNNKIDEPLMLSAKDMSSLLRCGGASEDIINDFSDKFETDFGNSATIAPANVLDIKKFEVNTPDVTIRVSPEHSDLIETRIIDGTKYLLVRADGDVEVNGIKINIK